jgi:hypothetical protein
MTITGQIMKRWGARLESLTLTDFTASLPTSTATANSGVTAPSVSAELIAAKAAIAAAVPANSPQGLGSTQVRITV